MNKPQISFDEHGRVRVLEADKFQKTQALQTECNNFVRRITEFGGKVESVVKVLDAYSQRIEAEKMKAIGMRIKYESANSQLKVEERALREDIAQEKSKLERLTEEYDSLCAAKNEQLKIIEKMSQNAL